MADDCETMFEAVEQRGQQSLRDEPHAKDAHHDASTGRVLVDLENGCSFAVPAPMADGLGNVSDADLSKVEVLGADYGLHWEKLGVDLIVTPLRTT